MSPFSPRPPSLPWKRYSVEKVAEEIACLVAVLGARTSPIARNQGGRRKFPAFRLFSSPRHRREMVARHSELLFPKARRLLVSELSSRPGLSLSRLWLKVLLGLREQYLCQGSRACTFCSRAGEQKIETLSLSLSIDLSSSIYPSLVLPLITIRLSADRILSGSNPDSEFINGETTSRIESICNFS